jgi:hypothetical protein
MILKKKNINKLGKATINLKKKKKTHKHGT